MPVNQADKIDNKLVKQVESTKFRNRVNALHGEAKKLQKLFKKQKRMKADKKMFEQLDEVEDLAGKEKLAKLSGEALKNFQDEHKQLTEVLKWVTEIHKFLHTVINKEATPLAENFKRLAAAEKDKQKRR